MPKNTAAVAPGQNQPLEIQEVPYPTPGFNEIVVHNKAIAVNPVDYAAQMFGGKLFPGFKFPVILGCDVAGDVAEVGSSVIDLKAGDRVLGQAAGISKYKSAEGAFQTYPVLQANMASRIPASLSYEDAAVVPLGLSTAGLGLFAKDFLGLQYPSVEPKPTGKTLLIWGGATSVGSNGVQLAVAAGYEVITTASPKNFEFVKKLGASQVFDYRSATVQDELIAAFNGKSCAGALAIAGVIPQARMQAAEACLEVVAQSEGDKFVALAMPPPGKLREGVQAKFIGMSRPNESEACHFLYTDYLPKALAAGKYIPSPKAEVVGTGVEAIQGALDKLKQGVSATKLVVKL